MIPLAITFKLTILIMSWLLLFLNSAMAWSTCDYLPPESMRETPTVPYTIHYVRPDKIYEACDMDSTKLLGLLGCVRPVDKSLNEFRIFLMDTLTGNELLCAITHERGHLPPNNWDSDHEGFRGNRGWN